MTGRHQLVWLTAQGWDDCAHNCANDADRAAIAQWRAMDWPAVVRRREPGAAADRLGLGIPLPPDADGVKRRCAIAAPLDAIQRRQPPLPGPLRLAAETPRARHGLARVSGRARRL